MRTKSTAKKSAGMSKAKAGANISIDAQLEALDELFAYAGLKRGLRGKAGARPLGFRSDRETSEDLNRPALPPQTASNGVQWLPVPGWDAIEWLRAGFSTRLGGVSRAYCAEEAPGELNLGFTVDDPRETVEVNRRLFAEAVAGSAKTPLAALQQIHSSLLHRATAADAERDHPWKADGLFTDEPGLLVGVQTADCIPVLVADRKKKVVAAFHAGWRGTVKRIVENGIGRLRLEFGSRPEDLIAAIGPGIGPCCYAVGDEVRSEFESQFTYAQELFHEVYDSDAIRTKYPMLFLTQRAPGHSPIGPSLHLDLIEANRRQLLDAGLSPSAITVMGGCTNCRTDLFFSYRGSQGHAGSMMAAIGMAPEATAKSKAAKRRKPAAPKKAKRGARNKA
jgi:hypothetical protein